MTPEEAAALFKIYELKRLAREEGIKPPPHRDRRFKRTWADTVYPQLADLEANRAAQAETLTNQVGGLRCDLDRLVHRLDRLVHRLVRAQVRTAERQVENLLGDITRQLVNYGLLSGFILAITALTIAVSQGYLFVRGEDNLIDRALGTDFARPLQPGDALLQYSVTSGFGERRTHTKTGKPYQHQGIDLDTPANTPLYFPLLSGGTVECQRDPGGYGLYAVATPKNAREPELLAGHLLHCADGTYRFGKVFARTGGEPGHPNSGRSTGPHLHWEQQQGDNRVNPTKGYLVQALTGQKVTQHPRKSPGKEITALRRAIIGHESGGDFGAVNPHSGALGYAQLMPANVKAWGREATGKAPTQKEFLSQPDLQLQIIDHKLGQYWREELQATAGDEHTAVLRVASRWYSGNANLYTSTRSQYYRAKNGQHYRYPSIASYSQSVWRKYQQQSGQSL